MTEPTAPATPETPTTAPVAPQAPAAPEAPAQDVSSLPEWARASLTKANQEAAKYRTQVNELKPQADQFKALEEASKTELQRQTEALEQAKRDAESARSDALRYRIAAEHGIGKDDLDLLGSGDEAQITARAQRIAALNAAAQAAATTTPPTAPPVRRPVEQMRPGATPGEAESEDDVTMAALFGAGS